MTNGKPNLTRKQELFCKEYLVDLNATQAALRAGYSVNTAYAIGYENLNKPQIQEVLQNNLKDRTEKVDVTAEDVLRELAGILKTNILDFVTIVDGSPYVDLSKITREQGALIAEVNTDQYIMSEEESEDGEKRVVRKVKVKFWDKLRAADMLGKYFALFTIKHEHSGPDNGPIEFRDVTKMSSEELAKAITHELLNTRN